MGCWFWWFVCCLSFFWVVGCCWLLCCWLICWFVIGLVVVWVNMCNIVLCGYWWLLVRLVCWSWDCWWYLCYVGLLNCCGLAVWRWICKDCWLLGLVLVDWVWLWLLELWGWLLVLVVVGCLLLLWLLVLGIGSVGVRVFVVFEIVLFLLLFF